KIFMLTQRKTGLPKSFCHCTRLGYNRHSEKRTIPGYSETAFPSSIPLKKKELSRSRRVEQERMRRVASTLVVLLVCTAVLVAADSAKDLFKKGQKAETRGDYEAAFDFFRQAYNQKPEELKYRVSFERTRLMASALKVHRGQKLRDQGKLQDALVLFQQAAEIDPSNDLAAQEIRRTQQMIQKQSQPANKPSAKAEDEEDPLRKRLEEATAPVMLSPLSNVPIDALELTADSKVAYETIGKLANINVLFDPDYTSRQIPLRLRKVSLQDALDIVALQSRTFWRPVTPNTIFVAQDTQAKRRELEQK